MLAGILVAGIAEAVAGCIAMGGGSYLDSEAEEGLYAAEIADESREIDERGMGRAGARGQPGRCSFGHVVSSITGG